MASTTALAKVNRPKLPSIVKRPRIDALFDGAADVPVTWLTATPGSGKTTAVNAWVSARKVRSVWLRLDEGDSDPASFFHYLSLAAQASNPRKRKTPPEFTLEYSQGLPAFARGFLEVLLEFLAPPAVLLIDDYQYLGEDSPLHAILADWSEMLPDGVRMIVCSHVDPPSAWSRLRARSGLKQIRWQDLRLNEDETAELAELRSGLDRNSPGLRQLHARTRGWAAGLVLGLEHIAGGGDTDASLAADQVFDYFAAQVVDNMPPADIDVLMRAALLPQCSADMLASLTDTEHAETVLRELARRSLFVQYSPRSSLPFEMHGLFREYLLQRGQQQLAEEELQVLRRKAAKLLAKSGQHAAAVELYLQLEDHASMVPLILEQAMTLVGQGRTQLLEDWIRALPEAMVTSMPWLGFWLGVTQTFRDPDQAYQLFDAAYDSFRVANDPLGPWMAWVAAVRAIKFGRHGFDRQDKWIGALADFPMDMLAMLPPDVSGQFSTTVLDVLYARQPDHPDLALWAERAESSLGGIEDSDQWYLAAQILVNYWVFSGVPERARLVLEQLHAATDRRSSPFAQLVVIWAEGFYDWMTDHGDHCVEICEQGVLLARQSGVHLMDQPLITHQLHALGPNGHDSRCEDLLQRLHEILPPQPGFDRQHYHYLRAWFHTQHNDLPVAAEHARSAVKLIENSNLPLFDGFVEHAMAVVLIQMGDYDEAAVHLEAADRFASRAGCPMLRWQLLLAQARWHLEQGQKEEGQAQGLKLLEMALALGRQHHFWVSLFFIPSAISRLCMTALHEGIETDYVRELIQRRLLVPEPAHLAPPQWPWPISISTLGGFALYSRGEALQMQKGQGRAMALLQLLVALGGQQVAEGRIAEILWPDSEGDKAHHALENLVYRLRKFLGIKEAIILQDGRLSLDPQLCHVDIWSLKQALTDLDQALTDTPDEPRLQQLCSRVLLLYRGPFLPEESNESEILAQREYWQSRLVRLLIRVGKLWEETGQSEQAQQLYEDILDADDQIEAVYQALIRLHMKESRLAGARAVYKRCERALARCEREPSNMTHRLLSG